MTLNRRAFLKTTALAGAGLSMPRQAHAAGYGDLVRDHNGLLDLPAGFSYVVIDSRGEVMDDGYKVPGKPSGMSCFEDANGNWILVRNHELDETDALLGPYEQGQSAPDAAYDENALGGASRVVISPRDLSIVSRNMVLLGTAQNGGGGPSPWGWLSCENSVSTDHGFVFLCNPQATTTGEPETISDCGRFKHGGAAVDGQNRIYLAEDRAQGCFYRMTPQDSSNPFSGALEALAIVDESGLDTGATLGMGDVVAVEWVSIAEPAPSTDSVRTESQSKGAALFNRGGGVWADGDSIWFSASGGGPVGAGQVFRLRVSENNLECVLASTNTWVLDMPDSLTVAPWGEVFFCEDGTADQYIRGIDNEGLLFDFASNQASTGAMAGACFSPDGSVLFVNLQKDHLTLAIEGPFPYEGSSPDTADDSVSPKQSGSGCGCRSSRDLQSGAAALAAAGAVLARRPRPDKGG